MKYFFITVWLLMAFLCGAQTQTKYNIIKKLNGDWVSDDDKRYEIKISNNIIIEHYKGEKKSETFRFRVDSIISTNKSAYSKGTGYSLTKIDQRGGKYYYVINSISNINLELVYSSGRVLDFKKK